MRRARTLHCSFCHQPGHYYPTCAKKRRADELMMLVVLEAVSDGVTEVLTGAFPEHAHLIRKAGRVSLRAYQQAGGRWTPPQPKRLLGQRHRRLSIKRSR